MNFSEKQKGIAALITLAAMYAFMGVFTRYLAVDMSIFQQVYLRLFAAAILGTAIFYKKIDFKKLFSVSIKEWTLLIFRALTYYLLGTVMFNQAILETKISTVSFISSIPMTAILGFLVIGEKISPKKILYIALAFVGVVIISVRDFSSIFVWGNGEILAFLSAFFCSLSIVLRKWQTKKLNNIEMTQVIIFFGGLMVLIGSFFFGGAWVAPAKFSIGVITALILGGLFNVIIIVLTNVGFEKIKTSLASNILTLEMFFAVIFGFLFYREIPSLKAIAGAILIVLSVIQMSKLPSIND